MAIKFKGLKNKGNVSSNPGKAAGSIQVNDTLSINAQQQVDLMAHLTERLDSAALMRARSLETYRYIDREYYGYLLRDADDQQRARDNARGVGIKPTDEKLSMIFAQLDEAQTYLLSVLAPDEAMYGAIAPADQQQVADGFASLMNRHAEYFSHYNNYAMFLLDALKYNIGAFGINWMAQRGQTLVSDAAGRPVAQDVIVQDGNEVVAHDPYNMLLDPSIEPIKMPTLGEFFANIELQTKFRLTKMRDDGELFNIEAFTDTSPTMKYFESHPDIRSDAAGGQVNTNWVDVLMARSGTNNNSATGYEVIPCFFWIKPKQFGLGDSDNYEIWRFVLGSNTHILSAQHQENAHGLLPINITVPFQDHFSWQTKSAAERLIPHQRFASFTMNTHQRAVRKKLYGLTIFDQSVIPLMDQDDTDMAGGKIPANTNGVDVDLRKKIIQFNDGPDTTNTLQNIEIMDGIMQNVLPTNILKQVAGLDRATQYQAAATVQGANRRNLKIAKIINSQAMDSGRLMQMYNILQFQQQMEILDEQGNLTQIDPKQFRDTKIEFTIADGLKGLDRLALQINMKEIIAMVLQSQQASAQTDVMKLINYLSTLFGDFTDFNQFKIESPIDALPPEQRNLAFQLLQAAIQAQEEGGQAAPPAAPGLPQVTR